MRIDIKTILYWRLVRVMRLLGFDPETTVRSVASLPWYLKDCIKYAEQYGQSKQVFESVRLNPQLFDRNTQAGVAKGDYFYQDLLVAQRIFRAAPHRHVDVGSRIDGFVAHVASFRQIEVFDLRPIQHNVTNITFRQANFMNEIDNSLWHYCDSLSCLHSLEHFGLGRYGDPVRWDGYMIGYRNLYRMLKANGRLYLSFPIGPQRVEFNAHRVFALSYIVPIIERDYRIDGFSFVDDGGLLHEDVRLSATNMVSNFGCRYGCGIFELTKL